MKSSQALQKPASRQIKCFDDRQRSAISPLVRVAVALGVVSCLATAPVLSQTNPTASDIAQEQRRQQLRNDAERQRLERSADVRALTETASTLDFLVAGEEPCLTLKQFEIVGTDTSRFGWLTDSLSGPESADSPMGRCLGAQGIALLVKRAQTALVARGFVTSRVLVEPQNLASGTLKLTAIAGRIRGIRFVEPLDPRASQASRWLAMPAKPGDILNLRDIEQALENFKRVPTADVDIKIAPAESTDGARAAPDQSDLLISYKQGFPARVSLTLDDTGAKTTGKYQSALSVSLDNLFTLNDLFYITLNQGLGGAQTPANVGGNAQGTYGNTIHYSLPVGYWTFSTTVGNSRYFQTVAGLTQNYVYRGTSSNVEAKLQHQVYRDASRKTSLSIKAFQRRSQNFIDDTEVQVQRRSVGGWEAGVSHKEFIGQATLDINTAYKQGTGAFGSLPAPEELFNEGTSRFALTSFDVSLNTPFKLGEQKLRFGAQLRGQGNGTRLTPQDRFAIGGRFSVRGFDGESALSAERGWLVRNELGVPLGGTGAELYAALDHGEVAGPTSALLAGQSLTGAAFGLRGALKNIQYDIFAGLPVRKPQLFRTANSVVGFAVTLSY